MTATTEEDSQSILLLPTNLFILFLNKAAARRKNSIKYHRFQIISIIFLHFVLRVAALFSKNRYLF